MNSILCDAAIKTDSTKWGFFLVFFFLLAVNKLVRKAALPFAPLVVGAGGVVNQQLEDETWHQMFIGWIMDKGKGDTTRKTNF